MSETDIEKAPLALTVAEAAAATGLSSKAIRRRVERGSLPSVRGRDGLVHVPRSALISAGLLPATWQPGAPVGTPSHAPTGKGGQGASPAGNEVIQDLIDRLERQAEEVGRLRALTQHAESLQAETERLRAELFEARARVTELEHAPAPRRRLFFRR